MKTLMVMLTLGLCLVGCGKKEENPQSNDDDMADGDGDAMPTTGDDSSPKEPTQPEKPLPEDIPSLKALAEEGDARAQNSLGWNYVYGQGVEMDNREGIKWYLKAAEQGYAKAQYSLGVIYREGEGVLKDFKEAVKLFRKAAEQGYDNAQVNLGAMYANGNGVPQDNLTAYAWWNIADTNGQALAKKYKDIIAGRMTPAQITNAEALVKEMVTKNPKLLKK